MGLGLGKPNPMIYLWGCGEMANTVDLKSAVYIDLWVRVPPSPPYTNERR